MNQNFQDRLKKIIEVSFDLLEMKIANGGIIAKNEASFQLELSYILKVVGQLYEFHPKEKFHIELEKPIKLKNQTLKSNSKKPRIDIYMVFGTDNDKVNSAIELKFLKKENQREPNNRYDIFKDLAYLEDYKDNETDICYFYISTDHSHYVNQSKYSEKTKDFDFRDGINYISGKTLEYRTAKPYGNPITLKGNYEFNWSTINDLHFMRVQI